MQNEKQKQIQFKFMYWIKFLYFALFWRGTYFIVTDVFVMGGTSFIVTGVFVMAAVLGNICCEYLQSTIA